MKKALKRNLLLGSAAAVIGSPASAVINVVTGIATGNTNVVSSVTTSTDNVVNSVVGNETTFNYGLGTVLGVVTTFNTSSAVTSLSVGTATVVNGVTSSFTSVVNSVTATGTVSVYTQNELENGTANLSFNSLEVDDINNAGDVTINVDTNDGTAGTFIVTDYNPESTNRENIIEATVENLNLDSENVNLSGDLNVDGVATFGTNTIVIDGNAGTITGSGDGNALTLSDPDGVVIDSEIEFTDGISVSDNSDNNVLAGQVSASGETFGDLNVLNVTDTAGTYVGQEVWNDTDIIDESTNTFESNDEGTTVAHSQVNSGTVSTTDRSVVVNNGVGAPSYSGGFVQDTTTVTEVVTDNEVSTTQSTTTDGFSLSMVDRQSTTTSTRQWVDGAEVDLNGEDGGLFTPVVVETELSGDVNHSAGSSSISQSNTDTGDQGSLVINVSNDEGAPEASLTLNGHGIEIDEDSTTVSGGTTSTSLTLNDEGATFSDSNNEGGPARVTGVANGSSTYDAVNYGQLSSFQNDINNQLSEFEDDVMYALDDLESSMDDLEDELSAGIAISNAMEVLLPDPGKKFRLNVGGGFYNGENAVGVTGVGRVGEEGDVAVYFGVGSGGGETGGKVGVSYQW